MPRTRTQYGDRHAIIKALGLRTMKVGDSAVVDKNDISQIRVIASAFAITTDKVFSTRQVSKGNERFYRVWRVS